MKKTRVFQNIIAGVLSAITIFSVSLPTAVNASAAVADDVTVSEYNGNTLYY